MKTSLFINRLILRKAATAVLITASLAAFATLGDGGKKGQQKNLLSSKALSYNYKNFTLKSGYNYRGSNILNSNFNKRYITLNTVITVERGNNTYILPMKKKVLLDKIKFNPSPARY